jgi:hypothetical protein
MKSSKKTRAAARSGLRPSLTETRAPGAPLGRLRDREGAAAYLNVSVDTVDRLIDTGALAVVRLPVTRSPNGRGEVGQLKNKLLDVKDLDALIDRSKESSGHTPA